MTLPSWRIGEVRPSEELLGVLMVEASGDEALMMAQRLRKAVAKLEIAGQGSAIRMTASIGVAVAEPASETLADAIRSADAALYRAKSGGRDRVELAETPLCPHFEERLVAQ